MQAMHRQTTQESLVELREQLAVERDAYQRQIIVSSGTCAEARGSLDVVNELRKELANQRLADEVLIRVTGCHGFCAQEPSVIVQPGNIFYRHVSPGDAGEIISETVVRGKVIERLLYTDPSWGKAFRTETEIPFYAAQDRVLLGQNKLLDPKSIRDSIANGGYSALANVLARANPARVIEELKLSGLRSRASDGLPTGQTWESLRNIAVSQDKYVICSADVGDPGANIDRNILEGNPHAVLEGMIIGAYTIGANKGCICVRNEHLLAMKHAERAIENARKYGLLGINILGSTFSFDVDVIQETQGLYSGEETTQTPEGVHTVEQKFWNGSSNRNPVSVSNAETWANIPGIVKHGAAWFADKGFTESTGTKIFSLSGPIKNPGFVEVPMGTSLRTIVCDFGGGVGNGGKMKAVQAGEPSGHCLPVSEFHLRVDFDSLGKPGAMVGSGGMVVMDHSTCMVDVAKRSLKFLQNEARAKCSPCQTNIDHMLAILTDITEGRGHPEQLYLLEELSETTGEASPSALSKTVRTPVLSTLRYFRSEYEAHIQDGRCPAGVCHALVHYTIQEKKCNGCGACRKACPMDAITGRKGEPHAINPDECTKCGKCSDTCKFDALTVT